MRNFPDTYKQIHDMVLKAISKTPLDPFPVFFEVVSSDEMNAIASYVGFPTRYPHWRFGMEYGRHQKMDRYGLQKMYELVINNNPSYAYLLGGSDLTTIKMVMAHVYGHSDFFKNNYLFKNTSRNMINKMGDNAAKIQKIINARGVEKVETFIDHCLMIEDLIDPNYMYKQKERKEKDPLFVEEEPAQEIPRFKAKDYMQKFINPSEFLEAQRKRIEKMKKNDKEQIPKPDRNIMKFLLENAPLNSWEEQVLEIIMEESYYFLPQKHTKIMNEGWASYWHSKLMTGSLLKPENQMEPNELLTYCDLHSKIIKTHENTINPYRLGVELFRHIEHIWNTGRHGREYDECEDMDRKAHWNNRENSGLEKILLVRQCYNDLMFIDEFFTEDFAREHKYFIYVKDDNGNKFIMSKEFSEIKEMMLKRMTNFGMPLIYVTNSNFRNEGELALHHQWTGTQLNRDFAETTLSGIAKIWKRPVHINTKDSEGKEDIRIMSDGEKTITEIISKTKKK